MRNRAIYWLAFLVLCAFTSTSLHPGGRYAAALEQEESPTTTIDPRRAIVTMADGSQLKVRLTEDPVVILTPHGKLSVPASDVRRIVFALRLTDGEKQQIARWIETLGDSDMNARTEAAAELFAQQARAWQPLEEAAKDASPQIAKEAEALLDKLWAVVSEEDLPVNDLDIVETPDAIIAGRIASESIRIETTQFGELQLKLADARTLRSLVLPESAVEEQTVIKGAQSDPGNLKALEGRVGESFSFKVTGGGGGNIWGSNPYTTDSRLSATVVHCGLLKDGETGVITVKILGNLPAYVGTTRNGLTSNSYGDYPAYEISKPKKARPRR